MSNPRRELTASKVAPVFAALGDGIRLELLTRLSNGQPQSISQLTLGLSLTRQGVSKHLSILEQARLVTRKRVGRESQFSLQHRTLNDAGRYLDRASEQWDEAMGRLRDLVEK